QPLPDCVREHGPGAKPGRLPQRFSRLSPPGAGAHSLRRKFGRFRVRHAVLGASGAVRVPAGRHPGSRPLLRCSQQHQFSPQSALRPADAGRGRSILAGSSRPVSFAALRRQDEPNVFVVVAGVIMSTSMHADSTASLPTPDLPAETPFLTRQPMLWLAIFVLLALGLRAWKISDPLQRDEFGALYAVAERKTA